MLNQTERALVKTAVQHADESVAQVVADSLAERGQVLGALMQAAMMRTRDLSRERELLPEVRQALREAGLKWAEQLSFFRGLPVAARADALRFSRGADEQTLQWPLEELWLEGSEVGMFYAALGSPVVDHVRRLTLDGSIFSQYTMFVGGSPDPLRVLPELRWLRPLAGEIPSHWVPIFLPAFANVEVLCVSPGVELGSWLEVTPKLSTVELRLTQAPEPEWADLLLERARRRGLKVRVNGVEVQTLEGLARHGLVRPAALPDASEENALPALAGGQPPGAEPFDGQTVRLESPQGDSWSRYSWRRGLNRQVSAVLGLPELRGITRLAKAAANSLRTEVTFVHRLQRFDGSQGLGSQRVTELRTALQSLETRGLSVPAMTWDMLYLHDGALEVFPVSDFGLVEPWPSIGRLVGLPLLPEHQGTGVGLELLVRSVEWEWKHGQPLAPTSFDELSLRRAWRALM